MTTSELIIRGALIGILLFSFCRWLYLFAFAKGFRQGGEYVLEKWKESFNEDKNT